MASPRPGSPGGARPLPTPRATVVTGAGATLQPGGRIGKYDVKRKIGQGGMGAVFEGVDRILKRPVALKVLPDDVASDPQALKRFVREAQAAASLNHPNVVTVFDIAQSGSTCYIAMELVPGQSVQDLLEHGPLNLTQATRVAIDCGEALAAAHRAGLVHRDVKPANILVGSDGRAKLSDFGLAKNVGRDKSMTNTHAIVGTPNYMSPEQCEGDTVDWRGDLYSLGATYFAMLTGKPPFDRGTVMKVMYAHCHEPVPDPRALAPTLPPECTAIIVQAMAKSPSQRYQKAEQMLSDLKAVLGVGADGASASAPLLEALADLSGPPGESQAPMVQLTEFRPSRRPLWMDKRVQVGFFVAAALTLVLVLGWTLLGRGRSRTPAQSPSPTAPAVAPAATPASAAPSIFLPPPAEAPAAGELLQQVRSLRQTILRARESRDVEAVRAALRQAHELHRRYVTSTLAAERQAADEANQLLVEFGHRGDPDRPSAPR